MARSPLTSAVRIQYSALAERAGAVDLSDRTQLSLSGNDCVSFLHNLCTNDIKLLQPGQGCEAFVTNVQGRIVGYPFIFRETDRLVLDTSPGQAESLLSHLDRYIIREDVQLADCSQTHCDVLLSGPDSERVLRAAFDTDAPADLYSHIAIERNGMRIRVSRIPWSIQPAFLLRAEASHREQILAQLEQAGAEQCTAEAAEIIRIEAGLPLFGRDIQNNNLPQEVGRDKLAISFVKGCYLGQETVARIDALGHVNQKLLGLRLGGEQLPESGSELLAADKKVGFVTSAAWSPRCDGAIAIAYIRRGHHEAGKVVMSSVGEATVTALPFT